MKRLSFFRLTRILPPSIALSGIAALVGCVNPTTNTYDGGTTRRGSVLSSSSGWIGAPVPAGTIVDERGVPVDGGSCGPGGCGSSGRGSVFGHGGVCGSIDRCATVPPGALPAQLGSSIRAYHKVQKENADADKYVVYQHEWYSNGIELGPWGRNHVYLVAKRLREVNVPVHVIVQASPDGQLNDLRRQRIIEALTRLGVPGNIEERVEIGFPEAIDLDGNEAPRIYYQMLVPGQYQNNGFGNSNFGNLSGFNNNIGGGFGGFGGGFGGFGGGARPFGF